MHTKREEQLRETKPVSDQLSQHRPTEDRRFRTKAANLVSWLHFDHTNDPPGSRSPQWPPLRTGQLASSGRNGGGWISAIVAVAILSTIVQNITWIGYWLYTTGGRTFGLYPVYYTLVGVVLLRSQPLYCLFFVLIGNTFTHGMTPDPEPGFLAVDISMLIPCALFLILACEWNREVGPFRRRIYAAAVAISLSTALAAQFSDFWESVTIRLVFLAFAAHTERCFFLGGRRTLRACVLTTATALAIALMLSADLVVVPRPIWGHLGMAAMILGPLGCLLYEWAHRWMPAPTQSGH